MLDYCGLARTSLDHWLRHRRELQCELRAGLRAGCFVSLHDAQGRLRGCIGTISPAMDDLVQEVLANAVAAGTRDHRFEPVSLADLSDLVVEVSVLQPPEPIAGVDLLDPVRYGVVVEAGRRRGVLLPDLEGVNSVDHQLQIARRKAKIAPEEPCDLWRFEVEKHHERSR